MNKSLCISFMGVVLFFTITIIILKRTQLLRFLVVETVHQGSISRLGSSAPIFLDLFQDLTSVILSVVDDVPIDSEGQW